MRFGVALKMQAGNYDLGEVALKGAVAPGERKAVSRCRLR